MTANLTLDPVLDLKAAEPLRAALLERMNRTDEAIREVEQLGRDYPDSALPDIDLGDLLRTRHRFGDAVAAYDRAIGLERDPSVRDFLLAKRAEAAR